MSLLCRGKPGSVRDRTHAERPGPDRGPAGCAGEVRPQRVRDRGPGTAPGPRNARRGTPGLGVSAADFILAAVAIGCIPAASALATASWPRRSPVAAILLWQALGLSWGLAAVGALIGFAVSGNGATVGAGALERLASLATTDHPAAAI